MKRASKAYKDIDFLKSREARTVRILAEYLEPEKRFAEHNVKHTVVFFGSARVKPYREDKFDTKKYYWAAEELAFKLATWAKDLPDNGDSFKICTGGGPGIMEAANRGAKRANSKTIGLNISLPHEQEPNNYITPELNFEFHYFFMRKLWFVYYAKALICFPGGYGTLDELFEALTLIQTNKLEKTYLPILLYDKAFWEDLINFDKLVKMKLISPHDAKLFHFFNTPVQGMEYLKPRLEKIIKNFHEPK